MKIKNAGMRALLSMIFVSAVFSVMAEKAPMKYGKVDPADLAMTFYPADSSASAVVLCNYGYWDSNQFQFVHQMRIKILKEEGKSYGDIVVPASEKATVKGQTVNLENGVPVVTKLGRDGIFIEKITKNAYRARAAMPNVKVGSVLDVEFYYSSLPDYWEFQKTIPIRWSELILEQSTYFSFRKNLSGYIHLSESSDDRWVAKDVPAFKAEPFMNNVDNYLSRFDIEIERISYPGFYREYATSWNAVAGVLMGDDDFGGHFHTFNLYLNGLEKEIKNTAKTPEDQMAMAYDAMKKVKWNKKASIWPSSTEISEAFRKKIGNVSDINLSLIVLLRKLDIEANPVVLSTRDNGVLPPYSVSLDKLNYVIVRAVIGEKTYLLDATEEYCPLGLLPERTINGRGLVMKIKDKTFEWVDLNAVKKDKTVNMFDLKLSADGVIKGKWNKSAFDYAALSLRNDYKSFNSEEEYLKDIESDNIGLSIENYKVTDLDSLQKPVQEEFNFVLKNKVTKTNNQMFICPMLFNKYTENPFKLANRLYPVDFLTPVEEMLVFILELPEGYSIEQLPKNIKITLPENTASLQMQSIVNDNKVQVLFKFFVNKSIFYQSQYQDLKAFFDEVVKKENEMLVIKKNI